jgi:DNA polymerase bacteriophage-type
VVGEPERHLRQPFTPRVHMLAPDYASIDFETFAVRNLKLVGTHVYAEDPFLKVNCMGWAINHDTVQVWKPWEPFPKDLKRHIERGGMIHAWHAMFERLIWAKRMAQYVEVKRHQWSCTMVRALACGFPGALEYAAPALRVDARKDMEGQKAMRKLMKPRKIIYTVTGEVERVVVWEPEQWRDTYNRLYAYCGQDVVTERACGERLPYLPLSEQRQYWYDQKVADRGIRIDTDLCEKAIRIVNTRTKELAKESHKLCGFNPTQPVKLKNWLNEQGLEVENVKKETVERALQQPDLPSKVRLVLQCRLEGGRSSTAKYKSALMHLSADGTVKGTRQFYGAHTGRWAGRGVQMDNLKRLDKKYLEMIDDVVEVVKQGQSWLVESCYGNVMEPVSNCTRSMIIADEGYDLYVADFKSIESRMLAATTGQESTNAQWMLSDMGLGPDVYVKNAAELFNVPISKVVPEQRFWGKIEELALGYEGGCGALMRQTEKNNAYFRDIYNIVYHTAEQGTRDWVNQLWKIAGKGHEKDWKAARYVVERWRDNNPMTVKFWRVMRFKSIQAVLHKGSVQEYRGIKFWYDKKFKMLVCQTLSGRCLYYPFAHVVGKMKKNYRGQAKVVPELRAYYQSDKPRRFIKYNPYGGLFTENIIQHEARDAMADKFVPLEKHGFQLRHTVHDELISQAKKFTTTLDIFNTILCTPLVWVPQCPLAVESWSGPRYKKGE